MMPGLLMAVAWAQTSDAASQPDFSGLFFKTMALLAIIVVLGFLLVRYVGKVGRVRGKSGSKDFEMLSWMRIEPKKSLYLVRIGKRKFALGSAEHNLNLIAEMTDEDLEI